MRGDLMMSRILVTLIIALLWVPAFANTFTDEAGNVRGLGLLQEKSAHGKLFWSPSKNRDSDWPAKLDLRETSWVSEIKDQGSCGSCWSFAIVKALESARMRAGLPELDLGEQEMVSCAKDAHGCGGGYMSSADYIVDRGISLESDYPYVAKTGRCKNPLPAVADKAVRWAYVGSSNKKPTVEELKAALNTYGVLFVTVAAGGSDWNGAVHHTSCRSRGVNHMVTLVGYNEQDEFIIGNSWGKGWGEGGFAYSKQGCNQLADEVGGAAFVVYEGGPSPLPPKVKLPAEVHSSTDIKTPIGVPQEPGVSYEWYADTQKVGSGNLIWVQPSADTVYRVSAKTAAGTAESTVLVRVTPPAPPVPPLPPRPENPTCWRVYDELAFCVGTTGIKECSDRADILKACVL
jgi:hypothetical protein